MSPTHSRTPCIGQPDDSVRLDGLAAETLRYLVGEATPVTLADLAEGLVAVTTDIGDAHRLQVRLHHVTLPKLASVELLAYDATERVVDRPTEEQNSPPSDEQSS